jgi:lipooligosaccharide transport system ATP-binding protein
MDGGRIVAHGSPAELIAAHSSREVVELRFPPGGQPSAEAAVSDLVERVEVLPDRLLLYTENGDHTLAEVTELDLRPTTTLVRRSTLEDVFLRLTGRSLID